MWRSSTGHSAVHKRCCLCGQPAGEWDGAASSHEAHLHDNVMSLGKSLWWAKEEDVDPL